MEPIKSIIIIGRKWWRKTLGGFYHSSVIFINGKFWKKIPCCHGGGTMYLQNATQNIAEEKILPLKKNPHGGYESLIYFCKDNNIYLEYFDIEVPRKRDL
jgi:hypothetical protein